MPNRSRTEPKRPRDMNQRAASTVALATGEALEEGPEIPQAPEPTVEERHAAAVALGWAGGKKGGPARAARMTAEERSASAKKAARARWAGKKP